MGPIRALWIALMLCIVGINYGAEAVGIGLLGHVGLKAVAKVLSRFLHPLCLLCINLAAIAGLMYWSVAAFGWGCFWLLFLSFCAVEIKHV